MMLPRHTRTPSCCRLAIHYSALDEVLELTSGEFDNAIMGDLAPAQAKSTLDIYASKFPGIPTVDELVVDIKEAQTALKKGE